MENPKPPNHSQTMPATKPRSKTRKTTRFPQPPIDYSNHQPTQPESLVVSNDDLLTEILIRLPVTSILRFKSVSKHWRSLLTHTHFTRRYDNNISNISKSPGLFFSGDDESTLYVPFNVENPNTPPFRSLDTYINRPQVKIVQSCNGLLLCSTYRGPQGGNATLKYYVFNPTTKQLAIIPSLFGGYRASKTICLAALVFNQTDCVHYKLVCIRALETDKDSFQIQVYSSETRKWKICTESFDALKLSNPVYWNGFVYWAPLYLNRSHNHFCFKVDVERLQTFPLPEGLTSSDIVTLYLGESRGHLHFIAYKNNGENTLHMNVYEMLSDHSGWFVKYQVELDELPGAFPEGFSPLGGYSYNFSVVDVVRGEQEEDTFIVLKIYKKVITYNVHDKSFKHIFSLPNIYIYPKSVHRYTETLTSFKKTR